MTWTGRLKSRQRRDFMGKSVNYFCAVVKHATFFKNICNGGIDAWIFTGPGAGYIQDRYPMLINPSCDYLDRVYFLYLVKVDVQPSVLKHLGPQMLMDH